MKYGVAQGSITINGVSLTVGSIDDASSHVELWIIPETSAKTTFGTLKVGDRVNIEVDVLGKYVERLLAKGANSQ
jgi:riboflavin synthase